MSVQTPLLYIYAVAVSLHKRPRLPMSHFTVHAFDYPVYESWAPRYYF